MSAAPAEDTPRAGLLRKLFQLLLVSLGCLHLAGGPYSLVQVFAWTGMLVSYSQEDGLLQAAKDTFSGEKPCELCCKVAEARKNESDRGTPRVITVGKLVQEILPAPEIRISPPYSCTPPLATFPGLNLPVECGTAAPPTPPPRGAA